MKKSLYILIVIVIVFAGAYAINRYSGKGEVQSEGTDVPQDEYVTHTSKEFSFEYPKNWFVEDNWETGGTPYLRVSNYDPIALNNTPHPAGNYFKVEIWKSINDKNISLEKWIDQFMEGNDPYPVTIERKSITVAGIEGIEQIENTGPVQYTAIYLQKGTSVYLFGIAPYLGNENMQALDQILSTFAFQEI